MKKKLSLLVLIPLLCFYSYAATQIKMHYYINSEKYTPGNATITEEIKGLYIDWILEGVTVKYHSKDFISITENQEDKLNTDEKVQWWIDDDKTLFIRFCKSNEEFKATGSHSLTVYLPKKIKLNKLYVSSSSAVVDIANIVTDEAKIITTSGKVFANFNTALSVLNVSSSSGDLDLYCGDVKQAIIETASGNVKFNGNNIGEFSGIATSGFINLVGKDIYTVSIKTISGDIISKTNNLNTFTADTTSGNTNVTLSGKIGLGHINSTSGKINFSFSKGTSITASIISTAGTVTSDLYKLSENKSEYKYSTELSANPNLFITTKNGNVNVSFLQ